MNFSGLFMGGWGDVQNTLLTVMVWVPLPKPAILENVRNALSRIDVSTFAMMTRDLSLPGLGMVMGELFNGISWPSTSGGSVKDCNAKFAQNSMRGDSTGSYRTCP